METAGILQVKKCGYALDRLYFQQVDKFLVIAVICLIGIKPRNLLSIIFLGTAFSLNEIRREVCR